MRRVAVLGPYTPDAWRAAQRELQPGDFVLSLARPPDHVQDRHGFSVYASEADLLSANADYLIGAKQMKRHEFLWFDCETTGLDPHAGKLLEFAAVLCEDAAGDDFAIVDQFSAAIHHTTIGALDPYVQRMHTANGLLDEVARSDIELTDADDFLADLAQNTCPAGKITLAGTNPAFDLSWIRVHLPHFALHLNHRVFDVGTLTHAIDIWRTPRATAPGHAWLARDQHRALPDILTTIAEVRKARKALGL